MEDLQSLLEKINRDGVEKANARAIEIEADAKAKADALINDARAEATRIKAEAERTAADFAARSEVTVRQAARDLVLEVRASLTTLFERLLTEGVETALGDEKTLAGLIAEAVRGIAGQGEISVDGKLVDALRASLASTGGFTVTADETVRTGFAVKIDGGRIEHSFTGEVIAAELAKRLRPNLAALMN